MRWGGVSIAPRLKEQHHPVVKGNRDMAERIVVYPGSFNPITNGHTDLVERALHPV